jgi:hypothetical protein
MAPLCTFREIAFSTILYSIVWASIRYSVKHRGPARHAKAVLHFHSWVQVFFSSVLLSLTILSLLPPPRVAPVGINTVQLRIREDAAFLPRYLHHLSRIFEYLDLLFFVAAGNTPDIHFAFHHLTTQYLTYFRLLHDCEMWQVFTALNGFHHVLMHLFFAGAQWTHPILPWTRYIQLIGGIGCDLWLLRKRRSSSEADGKGVGYIVSAVLLNCYLVLLTREIMSRRSASERKGTMKSE